MDATRRAYFELHIAVFLFGFTAILGDLIEMSAFMLVWWRVLITTFSLLFLVNIRKLFKELSKKIILYFMGIGVIVALHWLTFFGAIKYANASIALVCFATTCVFTAILEPFIMKQKVKWYEIGLGLMVIPGMVLIVKSTDLSMQIGVWAGLLSAFFASLFGTLNKRLIEETSSLNITFLEMGSSWLFLSILLPFYFSTPEDIAFLPTQMSDWVYLIILSLLCTTLAYVLSVKALRYISAFATNLTVNLEPVYGILLAWWLLNDSQELSSDFYWGVLLILGVVFSYPLVRNYFEKEAI